VGLGLCVVDHFYVVETLDGDPERIRYAERLVACGGMIGTALSQAAHLGAQTHVISLVGADAMGRFVRRRLRAAGVRTRRLRLDPERPTGVAVVLVERRSGERRFLVADRRALERGVPDFDLSPIQAGSVLLVDGHFPAQCRLAVRRAREVGARVVGDFSRPSRDILRLLRHVDYPVLPMAFARSWTTEAPAQALRRLRDEYGGTPVFTDGARGGLFLEEGRVRRYRTPRVRVRDTTGAGDVFHGAFAAGLAFGLPLALAIEGAARAGAACCTALGGTGRLLDREEWLTPDSRAVAGAREGRDRERPGRRAREAGKDRPAPRGTRRRAR
jgi:sulfofructose kinase